MHEEPGLSAAQSKWHGSVKSYVMGFVVCFALTGVAFFLVKTGLFPKQVLFFTIIGLAIVQAVCQLIFFIHAGQMSKPYWEQLMLLFLVCVLLIIVIGTLWIMGNLEHRTMPKQLEKSDLG